MRNILWVVAFIILMSPAAAHMDSVEPLTVRVADWDGDRTYTFKCADYPDTADPLFHWSIREDDTLIYEKQHLNETITVTLTQDEMYHVGCFKWNSTDPDNRELLMYDHHINRRTGPYADRPNMEILSANDLRVSATCYPPAGVVNYDNLQWTWNRYDEHIQMTGYNNQNEVEFDAPRQGLWELACGLWDSDAQTWIQTATTMEFFEAGPAYVPNVPGCMPWECNATNETDATLTVDKIVINDDNGTLTESDFTLTIDGEQWDWSTAKSVTSGEHTIGELETAGYEATISGDCSADGTITLQSGDMATCTITNDDVPEDPPGNDTCYESVQSAPASCTGGDITQDSWNGCRTIVCGGLQVLACDKPDSGPPEYFEMYKQSSTTGVEICLLDWCIADNGFAQSDPYPLCTGEPTPDAVCGNGIIESDEQCDDGNTADGDGCSSTCQVEGSGNHSAPAAPQWLEPSQGKDDVHPVDFHIQVFAMEDTDGDEHIATDFEMWDVASGQRVWSSLYDTEILTHIHNADGDFEGNLEGEDQLEWDHPYSLRVRFYDGGPHNNVSDWSEWRNFSTRSEPTNVSGNFTWTARDGYTIELVASGVSTPVNIDIAPDLYTHLSESERPLLYVTQLYGQLGMIQQDGDYIRIADNLLNYESFGSLPGSGETGVTGLYVDEETGDVFVSMVYWDGERYFGKVERFIMNSDGDAYTSRNVILTGIPAAPSHQVQSISRGPDDKLYLNTGDSDNLTAPEDISNLAGKILRFNEDGSMPSDNPYAGTYVYAAGFRNPFGAAWQPSTGDMFVTENGPDSDDSVKRITPGTEHGWCCDVWENAWHLFEQTVAPVQLEFNPGIAGFPSETQGRLYVGLSGPTYSTGGHEISKRIVEFTVAPDGSEGTMEDLVVYTGDGYGAPIGLAFGEEGLYFSDIYGEGGFTEIGVTNGNIFLVKPGNQTEDPLPENEGFDASLSAARWYPQGHDMVWECKQSNGVGPFTYDYHFGDGESHIGTERSDVYHTYPGDGTYEASCTVHDSGTGESVSAQATLTLGDSEAVCGNGEVESGEECDDGNTVDGDGCSASCQLEDSAVCGNGVVESGEQCDDGNIFNGDGCSDACTAEDLTCDANDVLNEGETQTYSVGDSTYDVSLVFADSDEAQFSVNSEMGGLMQVGESESFTNATLTLIDVAVNGAEGMASFCMNEKESESVDLRIKEWYPQGLDVVFICEESGFNASMYLWDFGDGTDQTTTSDDVYHTYPASGEYTAQCIAQNSQTSGSDTLNLSVSS